MANEFLQSGEFAVESIIKNFQKALDVPAFFLTRHNSSSSLHLPSELPAKLLSAFLVWVHRGGAVLPLRRHPAWRLLLHAASPVSRQDCCRQPPKGLYACERRARQPALSWLTAGQAPRQVRRGQSKPSRPTCGQAPRRLHCGQAGVVFTPLGFSAFNHGAATAKRSRNHCPT